MAHLDGLFAAKSEDEGDVPREEAAEAGHKELLEVERKLHEDVADQREQQALSRRCTT
jgi:hypothetical protein